MWFWIGLPAPLTSILLLNRVPPPRVILGVGVAGLLLAFIFLIEGPHQHLSSKQRKQIAGGAIVLTLVAFLTYALAGASTRSEIPGFGLGIKTEIAFAAVSAGLVCLFLFRRVLAASIALVTVSALVSLPVNPVYRGLGLLTSSQLATEIHDIQDRAGPAGSSKAWLGLGGIEVLPSRSERAEG